MVMLRIDSIRKLLQIQRNAVAIRSSSQINIEKLENEEAGNVTEDFNAEQKEKYLQLKRNKSRLRTADYKFLHEENPYPEAMFWHHGTLKYIRRTYGRYGAASGVDPAICWPVKKELADAIEYEKIKYPYTIPQMIEEAKVKREEKERSKLQRQEDVVNRMQKLEQWKKELAAKIEKKESEAIAARLQKERLIEEVRRHFGYSVSPKEERFQELLQKKEKEQKKAMKEARKKEREDKLVKKLSNEKEKVTAEKNIDEDDIPQKE